MFSLRAQYTPKERGVDEYAKRKGNISRTHFEVKRVVEHIFHKGFWWHNLRQDVED
jgi:hypothetical protein